MKHFSTQTLATLIFLVTIFITTGCEKDKQASTVQTPESITAEDQCYICGMHITGFPGPKAQAFIRHQRTSLKFCSTADLHGWLLQPDTPAILETAYVHDMGAATSWDKPSDKHFVDASKAWYVAGHDQRGAMGPTLASFKEKQSAETYIKQHGGKLLGFSEINMEVLLNLRAMPSNSVPTKPTPAPHPESHHKH